MPVNPTFAIIIPARYSSSRFPGKPLAKIGGIEMILHVCRRASEVCENVIVATDDARIYDCVVSAGYRAEMTSAEHRSGTDRVREALDKSRLDVDVVINIQGDEPFIDPRQIRLLMDCFADPQTRIATLARRFDLALGFEALNDPNLVKLVFSDDGFALYFSRNVIPYMRGEERKEWPERYDYHTHVGIYAYRSEVLREITRLPESSLEKSEKLEQLRWLQAGYSIAVRVTDLPTIGIDTPEDLRRAEEYWQETHR